MKKTINLFLFYFLTISFTYSQLQSGDLEAYLQDYITNLPGNVGDDYAPPSNEELGIWRDALANFFDEDISEANDLFSSLNYQIVEYIDSKNLPGELYYLLEEKSPKNKNWGTYVFNASPCRDRLVIQAPHPRADINTGLEAIFCFVRLSAKALFLSGTHRCNHNNPSSCDGTTSVCGASAAYRVSDMAHNVSTPFQICTEALGDNNSETIFFQLHGFSKQDTDPYLILSNGTKETPTNDYAVLLSEKLFFIDSQLTFKIGHIDLDWNRLLGFTNTQSRYLNESALPCSMAAEETTGRFIHIEQEKNKLRADSVGWNKMNVAFKEMFSCLPVSLEEATGVKKELDVFPNPVNSVLNIKGEQIQKIILIDLNGRIVDSKYFSDLDLVSLNLELQNSGVFILVVQQAKTVYRRKIIIQKK